MKLAFAVLSDRPKIKIKLTRDSVSAGDDCDAPHERIVEAYTFVDPRAFVNQFSTGYLPSIPGFGHSWAVFLNGTPVAVMNNSEVVPKVDVVEFAEENFLHFRYQSH